MVSFFEGKEAGSFVPFAGDTLKKQAESLWHMAEDLDDSFDEVIRCLLSISGRIAVTGMGKSGHVARKWPRPSLPLVRPPISSIPLRPATGIWAWCRGMTRSSPFPTQVKRPN